MSLAPDRRRTDPGWHRAGVLLAAALLAGGCGLAEYENKVDSEQVRIAKADEDDQNLAEAADMPIDDVFFRPPKGIKRTPNEGLQDKLFLVFPSEGGYTNDFLSLWVAATNEPKDNLKTKVWNALKTTPELKPERVGKRSGHKELTFEKASYSTDKMVVYIYFYTEGDIQVVFVFQIDFKPDSDPARLKTVTNLIDYSLSTLAVGDEARKKDKQWKMFHTKS